MADRESPPAGHHVAEYAGECFRRLIIADLPVAQCDIADIFIKSVLQRIAKIVRYMSVPRAYSVRW